jgi:hypothetical protein
MFRKEEMPSIEGEIKKIDKKEELGKKIDDLKRRIGNIEGWDQHMAYEGDSARQPREAGAGDRVKELREQLDKAIQEKITLDGE